MESTEHLISRLTRERDAAVAVLETHRQNFVPRALVAADRLLGAYGIPWWITLESTLRMAVSSWALREHPIIGFRAMTYAMAEAATLLSRIDAVLPDDTRQ